MATKYVDGLVQVKDAAGDVNVIYPVTKAENVEGLLDESGKIPSSQLPDMDYLPLSGGTMTGDLIFSEGKAIVLNYEPLNMLYFSSEGVCLYAEADDLNSKEYYFDCSGIGSFGSVLTGDDVVDYIPMSRTITLTASGWTGTSAPYTQTVTVSGVLADEAQQLIQPIPKLSSQAAYMEAGVYASGQAANSLTFSCSKKPTVDLTVYVVIQGVA